MMTLNLLFCSPKKKLFVTFVGLLADIESTFHCFTFYIIICKKKQNMDRIGTKDIRYIDFTC